jgi:hypothetical protein
MPFTRLRQSLIQPNGSITGSLLGTASYAITSSYAMNGGGSGGVGGTLLGQTFTAVGSTSSYALSRSVVNSYEIVVAVDGAVQAFNNAYTVTSSTINFTENIPSGSLVDIRFLTTPNVNSASYALTSSYALNAASGGGSVSTGSIVNQTILYNFSSSQESTLTGLNLTGNKWGINVVEEWDSGSGDIYFDSCSLLLHFDALNSAGRFIDNSRNNNIITSSGEVIPTFANYKFGGASAYFDTVGDYLDISASSAFALGTGDFTIETWVATTAFSTQGTLTRRLYMTDGQTISSTPGNFQFLLESSNGSIGLYDTNRIFSGSVSIANGNWNHVAVTKQSNTLRLFINGTLNNSASYTGSITANSGSPRPRIGSYDSTSGSFNGYLDEFRITKGISRYTASFSVPTSAFPNSATETATKYIGLVGGLNDNNVDYGIEKLSDSSLKIKKLTDTQQPSGSFLSSNVDRVYVNVLNYENAVITGSISNAVTASYSLTSSNILGGTRNYVPLWTGTTTLSSSIIYQSGSNIGIGTINPPALLSVSNSLDDVRINNGSGLSSIRIYGYNQAGGAGFTGFLELQNTFASATNSKKFFRLNSTGTIEIINNAYTTAIFSLTDAGVLSTPGGGTSDVRKKQNIEYIIDDATPIINQFKPVVFEFIAQDVLTFKPDLVLGDGDKTDGTYGLDYDGILSLTVKSLQETNKKIKDLESTVNILIEEVNNLKSIIEKN